MAQKVFIPITDELLYEHPELITAPLRPFTAGQPCFHWLAAAGNKTGEAESGEAEKLAEPAEPVV